MLLYTFALAAALSLGPTYKCKDANGNWTETACVGAAKPEPSADAKARNEADEAAAREKRIEKVFEQYCDDTGYNEIRLNIECRQEQVSAFHWLEAKFEELKGDPNSPATKRLLDCEHRYHNEATKVIDAKMVKLCFVLP